MFLTLLCMFWTGCGCQGLHLGAHWRPWAPYVPLGQLGLTTGQWTAEMAQTGTERPKTWKYGVGNGFLSVLDHFGTF